MFVVQSFLAGLASSGVLTSGLRFLTKVAFEKSDNGLRKGACILLLFNWEHINHFHSHTYFLF
jgi:hypothetical protein